jgi:prepilin-type N-terminal cleavage/methylation domain-containing protein
MLNKKGFTLIELLVVVLIIGILAAIALPKYQVAVAKARATEALVNLKAVKYSAERYFLVHGNYPVSINDLDVDIPGTISQKTFSSNGGGFGLVSAADGCVTTKNNFSICINSSNPVRPNDTVYSGWFAVDNKSGLTIAFATNNNKSECLRDGSAGGRASASDTAGREFVGKVCAALGYPGTPKAWCYVGNMFCYQ